MTELGTFATVDTSTLDPTESDAAIRANIGLFVRGYATPAGDTRASAHR